MEYDDSYQIKRMILRYHSHLFTRFERDVQVAFLVRWKARAYAQPHMERMRRDREVADDPRIDAVLERGYDEFSRQVTERVLREHADRVALNRCPRCNRIPRTPQAKQCLWCKHDWH